MKLTVFGTGYVGLVTGACLADVGHDVCCMDRDAAKIERLRAGEIPIYEPGLEPLVRRNVEAGRLRFTTVAAEAVRHGDVLFIAVGTPAREDGSAELNHVLAVARTIGELAEPRPYATTGATPSKIVVDKSTVPVGTAARVGEAIAEAIAARGLDRARTPAIEVCSNPEFLKEGAAIKDFAHGARIIVGTSSEEVREAMRGVYAPYVRNRDRMMFMDVASAELTKYAANGMLATKISFMNEMANIAERLGADIEQVRLGIGSDPRIGYDFIYPGCGYGGSCFPKDVRAIAHAARGVDYEPQLLAAVDAVNRAQRDTLFDKLVHALGSDDLSERRIAVWGLSFKPGTDDMREAPSRALIDAVLRAGGAVTAYDPAAMDVARAIYADEPRVAFAPDPARALAGSDALVICTEWNEFRVVDFGILRDTLKERVLVDGRNLFDPALAARAGLVYMAVGRGMSAHEPARRPAVERAA